MRNLKRILFESAVSARVEVVCMVFPGLDLPKEHMHDGVMLLYGDSLAKPIPDLETTEAGISATLSFANTPIKTFVPWESVVKMSSPGRFISLWPLELDGDVVVKPKHQVAS